MAYKKVTQGGGSGLLTLPVATSGGAVFNLQNWGASIITVTSADVFTMAPPVAGCQKQLIFAASSSSVATVVRLSTAQTVSLYMSTGTAAEPYTMVKKAASASTVMATVVNMIGLSATQWLVTSVFPGATTTPTAALPGCGSVTFST
jgi:hypothetical protein